MNEHEVRSIIERRCEGELSAQEALDLLLSNNTNPYLDRASVLTLLEVMPTGSMYDAMAFMEHNLTLLTAYSPHNLANWSPSFEYTIEKLHRSVRVVIKDGNFIRSVEVMLETPLYEFPLKTLKYSMLNAGSLKLPLPVALLPYEGCPIIDVTTSSGDDIG